MNASRADGAEPVGRIGSARSGDAAAVRSDAAARARLRPMAAGDLRAVARLEKETFTMPWSSGAFRSLLRRRDVSALVAELDRTIVGYAVCWHVLEQGELANIAVAPELRGAGVGARLLRESMRLMEEQGVRQIYLEVRVSNLAAQAFYERFGFREVGRRTAYYTQPREDALVLYRGTGTGTGTGGE